MRFIKDPLWLFLVAGTAIFFAAGFFSEEDIPYEIDVAEADLKRLQDQWAMQMRRPATERELRGLVDQFVKEEIYYREARRLNLDINDTIVRRRMVQKLTFLTEDIATAVPMTDEELRTYYEANIERYRLPVRYTFRHRYYSSDRRADAKADATVALNETSKENPGDPFMLQKSYSSRSEREIGDLFGRAFASTLATLEPAEGWQGPVESAYGYHTIQLTKVEESLIQPFESVQERVRVDAQQAARQEANDAYYTDLKSRYQVNFGQPGTAE